MALSVNKVILIGNVGKDPEIRNLNNTPGKKVATFTLATTDVWYSKGIGNERGEKNEKTEWHNIVVFVPQIVEVVSKYVVRGSKLYVEGSIHRRRWVRNQNPNDPVQAPGANAAREEHVTEIVLQSFSSTLILLDSRASREGGRGREDGHNGNGSQGYDNNFMSDAGGYGIDDDVPF